jgi:hypothetical protein
VRYHQVSVLTNRASQLFVMSHRPLTSMPEMATWFAIVCVLVQRSACTTFPSLAGVFEMYS